MAYRAYFYVRQNGRSPFLDYLRSLNSHKEVIYIESYIDRLILRQGILPFPYAKKVVGKIWELRTKFGNRVFYFIHTNQEIILLDGYTKKRDRIEPRILHKVLAEYQDFLLTGFRKEFTSLKESYEEN